MSIYVSIYVSASQPNLSADSRSPLQDQMVLIYENGTLLRDYSFEEVRERAELPLVKRVKGQH